MIESSGESPESSGESYGNKQLTNMHGQHQDQEQNQHWLHCKSRIWEIPYDAKCHGPLWMVLVPKSAQGGTEATGVPITLRDS